MRRHSGSFSLGSCRGCSFYPVDLYPQIVDMCAYPLHLNDYVLEGRRSQGGLTLKSLEFGLKLHFFKYAGAIN